MACVSVIKPASTTDKAIIGYHGQDLAHLLSGDFLKPLRHDLHAKEEKPKAAERLKNDPLHGL
jgi:hypothetical protein